jgi:hypothetical protein
MKEERRGFATTWKTRREMMLAISHINIKKASDASTVSPNRPSLHIFKCKECSKEIKGSGPAARHRQKSGHKVERV